MTTTNPATPAQAANPGSNGQGQPNPSATTPPATTPGATGTPEGKVTISTEEYAKLQRAAARQLSFEKRKQFTARPSQVTNGDPDDPANQEIAKANERANSAERKSMQLEVRGKVRDLLDKPDFKNLPGSTRELILKNPHMLSAADNVDEALLDIEDFVRETVAGLPAQPHVPAPGSPSSGNPPGHETPPKINAGNPAPASGAPNLEETSNLRGANLSRATLRNAIRKQRGAK